MPCQALVAVTKLHLRAIMGVLAQRQALRRRVLLSRMDNGTMMCIQFTRQ